MTVTVKLEGLEDTLRNMEDMKKATNRNSMRRTLLKAGEPVADTASRLAPHETGALSFSIVVSTQLTRRHKAEQRTRESEVEVYIGPAGGSGAIFYASHQEFGTIVSPAHPFMRPAWESEKANTLGLIVSGLKVEVDKAQARAARKAARLAK